MIEFKKATVSDGMEILMNLRFHEKRTLEKLKINAPEALIKAIHNELPSFTVYVDEKPAAIFGGHSETLLGETFLWMLTTPLIEKHQIPLLRYSRHYVQWMRKHYGPVIGMVDSEFEASRNWLRWIGFKEVKDGDYIVMRYD